MATPTRLPLSLLTIVLLVVPGVLALEYYARRAGKRFQLGRIERIVYSVTFSLASLALLYLFSPFYFDGTTGWLAGFAKEYGFASVDSIGGLGIPEGSVLYVSQVLLALGLAHVSGFVVSWRADEDLDPRPPWQYAFNETEQEVIEIGMKSGKVVRGGFNEAAWESTGQDLYVDDPEEIHYDEGEETRDPTDIGRSILITESAIDYVSFVTEDPDTEADLGDPTDIQRTVMEQRLILDDALSDAYPQSSIDDFTDSGDNSSDDGDND